jgi:hypothetical protein
LEQEDEDVYQNQEDENEHYNEEHEDHEEDDHSQSQSHPSLEQDDDEGDDNEEEEKWSIRVRIISAVDLPPSIVPSTPLCPLLKIGVLTVQDEHELVQLEQSSTTERRNQVFSFHPPTVTSLTSKNRSSSNNRSRERQRQQVQSVQSEDIMDEDDDTKDSQTPRTPPPHTITKPSVSDFQVDTPLSSFGQEARIKLTSCKVTSLRDNGMMEWHEEMRWDDITLPLQTVLAVELCAKAILPPVSMVNYGGASNGMNGGGNNGLALAGGSGMNSLYSGDVGSMYSHSSMGSTAPGLNASIRSTDYDSLYERARAMNNNRPSSTNHSQSSDNHQQDSVQSTRSTSRGGGNILNFWRRGKRGLQNEIRSTSSTPSNPQSDVVIGAGKTINTSSSAGNKFTSRTNSGTSLATEQSDEMESASAAAAVARYLMSKGNSGTTTNTSNSTIGSDTNTTATQASTSNKVSCLSIFSMLLFHPNC